MYSSVFQIVLHIFQQKHTSEHNKKRIEPNIAVTLRRSVKLSLVKL